MNHLDQAKHNEDVLIFLDKEKAEDFFDWKITIIFYTALHYVRALAKKKKIFINHSHTDIITNIDPRNSSASMPLDQLSYDAYIDMFENSKTCRYDEYYDVNNQWLVCLRKVSYINCKSNLKVIMDYLKTQGLSPVFGTGTPKINFK